MQFFLFSLLVPSVGASAPAMFRDPAAFVAGLADANPATIKKMEDMVNDLIVAGQAEKTARIDEYNTAVDEHNTATAEFDASVTAEQVAAGNAAVQTSIWEDATDAEAEAADILTDRTNIMNAAQSAFDLADSFMNSEIIRIGEERVYLDKVVPLLESLLPGVSLIEGKLTVVDYIVSGRSLLGMDMAAPEAVQRIVDKVNALIGAGEAQRKKVIREQAAAQTSLTEATDNHAAATAAHGEAAGILGQAKNELDRLTGILHVKDQELQDATATLAVKLEVMNAREATMHTEVARLDEEDGVMHQVLDLLANINE